MEREAEVVQRIGLAFDVGKGSQSQSVCVGCLNACVSFTEHSRINL